MLTDVGVAGLICISNSSSKNKIIKYQDKWMKQVEENTLLEQNNRKIQ